MIRKRRHACRVVQLRKLDQPVFLAAYTQETQNWRQWHGRRVSLRTAQEMVAAGEAQAFTRQTANGIQTFYQETQPSRASRPSPTTLTLATMQAVARRSESELTPSERSEIDKFLLYPFEFDRRNPATIRPTVGAIEIKRAQQTLDRAMGVRKSVSHRTERGVRTWHAPAQAAA